MAADTYRTPVVLSPGSVSTPRKRVSAPVAHHARAKRLLAPLFRLIFAAGTLAWPVRRQAPARGTLYEVLGGPVEQLFAGASTPWAGRVVGTLLGTPVATSGFRVSWGGVSLLYSGLDSPAVFALALPLPGSPAALTVFDRTSQPVRAITLAGRPGTLRLQLPRRIYALAVAG